MRTKLPGIGNSIFSDIAMLSQKKRALNLAQGFPNYPADNTLKDLINTAIQKNLNQYAPMQGVTELRSEISKLYKRNYGIEIDAETEITITAGATQAIFSAIQALVHPGDEVIVIDPAYDSYKPAITLAGGEAISYALPTPEFRIDWNTIANLITNKTSLILVNTPHNPTGMRLNAEDWDSLADLVENKDIRILSDEVYEFMTYDGVHASVLSNPRLREKALATFSFGKSLHVTGWKVGYAIAAPEMTAELRKVHQFTTFCVHTPSQFAIAEYISDQNNLASISDFFKKKRDRIAQGLQASRFTVLPVQGTYFMLLDYSQIRDVVDIEFVHWLIEEYKIALLPISVFYDNPPASRIVRLCFAKDDSTLENAIDILCQI